MLNKSKHGAARLCALLIIAAMLSGLCACGDSDGSGMSFGYPVPAAPVTLDPQVCTDSSAVMTVTNIFEGLVRMGSEGEIIPGVAETMEVSSDGLVYTFKLRTDAKWHLIKNFSEILGENYEDGFDNSVTADDFVFGLRRAVSPATDAPDAALLFVIKNAREIHSGAAAVESLGVTAVDAHTLRITLASSCADFLSILAQPVCMPCNQQFFSACKGKYGLDLEYTMCNGPFYLSKLTDGSSLLIKRNQDYSGKSKALPYSITVYFHSDESTYLKRIADNSYSAVSVPDSSLVDTSLIKTEFSNTVWGFCFNCKDASLSDLYLRLALCSSFDRKQLGLSDSLKKATGLLPDCCRTGNQNYRKTAGSADFVAGNTAKAEEYITSALETLDTSSIKLTVLCTAEYEQAVRRVIQFWQHAFGISVVVEAQVVELDELKRSVKNGSYQIALAPVTVSSVQASLCLADYTSESENNIFGFESETYDNIVAKAFATGSTASCAEGCRTAESFLMQNGVFYPLFCTSGALVFSENISGIYASPAGEGVCFISALRAE